MAATNEKKLTYLFDEYYEHISSKRGKHIHSSTSEVHTLYYKNSLYLSSFSYKIFHLFIMEGFFIREYIMVKLLTSYWEQDMRGSRLGSLV